MRCAIYVRVSSEKQANKGLSLEAQKKTGMELTQSKGWTHEVFEDERTAVAINDQFALLCPSLNVNASNFLKLIGRQHACERVHHLGFTPDIRNRHDIVDAKPVQQRNDFQFRKFLWVQAQRRHDLDSEEEFIRAKHREISAVFVAAQIEN